MIDLTVVLLELTVLALLIIANGLLAGAEIAVVSARKARLHQRAKEGDRASALALDLANSPNRFLSTVQVGITAVAVAAGAFGGTKLAGTLSPLLIRAGLPAGIGYQVTVVLVVVGVTFATLILGELVPKRIALNNPERMAARAAKHMIRLSTLATPLVHLLGRSTDLVLRFVPLKDPREPDITEEEIRGMIAHATEAGVLEATEQQITERLFRLSDMTVERIMTPRESIVWLDRSTGPEGWQERLGDVPFARYPVAEGNIDGWVGYLKVQDLLQLALLTGPADLDSVLRKPHLLPPSTPVFHLLELFQWSQIHMALITADDGRVEGIVTLYDVMEGIVGSLEETRGEAPPGMVERKDGSWLVDGLLPFPDFLEAFDLQDGDTREFPTLHAFVTDRLGGQPEAAAAFRWKGLLLEVVDMDGSRVDKVLVDTEGDQPPYDAGKKV